MASEAEVRYHRSFLSWNYWENLYRPDMLEKAKRMADEVEAIRLKDPKAFENTRKSLAVLLKVQYIAGGYVARSVQQGNASGWVSGQPSDYQVAEIMKPKNPPQTAVKHPTTGAIAIPNVPFGLTDAHVHDQVLHPARMYRKTDQRFEEYATRWELEFSNLIYPYTRGFTPIIDHSHTVIGHFGAVNEDFGKIGFLIPSEIPSFGHDLQQLMDTGAAVFVGSQTGLPPGWRIGKYYTSQHKVEVRTGIDGEVISFRVFNTGSLEKPWMDPIDIISGDNIVADLVSIGVAVVPSLMRRLTAKLASRIALRGPTQSLARDGAKAAAKIEAKAVLKQITEGELVPLVRKRGASRVLTPPEMEAFLKDVLAKKPWLARLRAAHKLEGKSLQDALLKILQEWKDATGKLFLPVNKGSVKRLGSSGEGGWALDRVSGKEVLIIEKQSKVPKSFLMRSHTNYPTTPCGDLQASQRSTMPPVSSGFQWTGWSE